MDVMGCLVPVAPQVNRDDSVFEENRDTSPGSWWSSLYEVGEDNLSQCNRN